MVTADLSFTRKAAGILLGNGCLEGRWRLPAGLRAETGGGRRYARLLSAQFHDLLVRAGFAQPRPKDKNSGRGHSVRRTVGELSFHSLRHNTTSWLKRAGTAGNMPVTPQAVIAADLLNYLQEAHQQAQTGPIFPMASQAKIDANGESRKLSAQFHAQLVKAGLAEKRSKKNTGRGHSVKRTTSELSFHSLRHNTTSWLKALGVPESVVRDIIGHESEIVSRGYTHIDVEAKRAAIAELPSMLKQLASVIRWR